ncbi:hypothetical protein SteCoe_9358 [Stentor coeruleus]|uniref:Protein kinase domain-containing protein n=1 Tax=Stentor coeruleus TaxID=5963 RepID=A0A1R2CI79_9CILI|nr:hypothetical protein SteCoe_9358 [Stentor coeruleus]
MSTPPSDLLLLTLETLKTQAITQESQVPHECKKIFSNPIDLTLSELAVYYSIIGANNHYLLTYISALFTLRICKDSPMPGNQGLEYFETVKYFIDTWPQYRDCAMNIYSSALLQEISEANIESLSLWGQKIALLNLPKDLVEVVRIWLQIRFSSESYTFLLKIQESFEKQAIIRLINFIRQGQSLNMELDDIVNMSTSLILENIITTNDLKGFKKCLGEVVDINYKDTREIISYIKTLKSLDQENIEKLSFIEEKVGVSNNFKLKDYVKKVKNYIDNEVLISTHINWELMQVEPCPIYAHSSDVINVTISRIRFPDGLSMVRKSYTALIDDFDFSPIENEIKILTYLSNRSSPDNCFLKFFGAARESKSIHLYMEAGGKNLMDELTEYKRKNQSLDSVLMEKWVISLLNCFSDLSLNKIYHCDIKPHNIVIYGDNKLKVIDFSISKFESEREVTIVATKYNPIQGTRGYMAPELQDNIDKGLNNACYKEGKADVFSLGMTFLQMMTFEDLTGLNKLAKTEELHQKIDSVKGYPMWINNLLHAMLRPTRDKRPSFNKCLAWIRIESGSSFTTFN